MQLHLGPVTFHLVRRPTSAFSRQPDIPPGIASSEADKFCPCLVQLNPGYFNMQSSLFSCCCVWIYLDIVCAELEIFCEWLLKKLYYAKIWSWRVTHRRWWFIRTLQRLNTVWQLSNAAGILTRLHRARWCFGFRIIRCSRTPDKCCCYLIFVCIAAAIVFANSFSSYMGHHIDPRIVDLEIGILWYWD